MKQFLLVLLCLGAFSAHAQRFNQVFNLPGGGSKVVNLDDVRLVYSEGTGTRVTLGPSLSTFASTDSLGYVIDSSGGAIVRLTEVRVERGRTVLRWFGLSIRHVGEIRETGDGKAEILMRYPNIKVKVNEAYEDVVAALTASTSGGTAADGNGIYDGSDTIPNNTTAFFNGNGSFGLGSFAALPDLTLSGDKGLFLSPTYWGESGLYSSDADYKSYFSIAQSGAGKGYMTAYTKQQTTGQDIAVELSPSNGVAGFYGTYSSNRAFLYNNTATPAVYGATEEGSIRNAFGLSAGNLSRFRGTGRRFSVQTQFGSGTAHFDWLRVDLSSTDTTLSKVLFYGGRVTVPNPTINTTALIGLSGSASLDFPSTSAQTASDLTITVTGAAAGDVVSLGVPSAAATAGGIFTARVSATNTVTVTFANFSSGPLDPTIGTFKVQVHK